MNSGETTRAAPTLVARKKLSLVSRVGEGRKDDDGLMIEWARVSPSAGRVGSGVWLDYPTKLYPQAVLLARPSNPDR